MKYFKIMTNRRYTFNIMTLTEKVSSVIDLHNYISALLRKRICAVLYVSFEKIKPYESLYSIFGFEMSYKILKM